MKTYWRTRIRATTYRGTQGFSVTAWEVTETGTRVGSWPARIFTTTQERAERIRAAYRNDTLTSTERSAIVDAALMD